jgi:hypothetical protein
MAQIDGTLLAAVMAVVMSIGGPLLFVALRHEVRVGRLRILHQFDRIFRISKDEEEGGRPSLEYVREKYMEDIPEDGTPEGDAIPDYKQAAAYSWYQLKSTLVLLVSAIPYIVLSAGGIFLLFACLGPAHSILTALCEPLWLIGGTDPDPAKRLVFLENGLTVASIAFLGAYIFSLGTLSRALATFDLSPITYIRVTIHMMTGVAAVVVAYRTFPDLLAQAKSILIPGAAEAAGAERLPRAWYIVAFVFGLVPDLAMNWLMGKLQEMLGSKAPKNDAFDGTKSVPLSVIDGVDFFTRFRLQQANIYEVQNLAVANPIMMFVETPYGIYQCIDWVGQAQLCTAVGPDRFITLRRYNIRTIFDLERAMLSHYTTSQMRRFVASLMLSTPSKPDKDSWKFWSLFRRQPQAEGDLVGSDRFGAYAAKLFADDAEGTDGKPLTSDPDRTLKHLGRIVVDDLHVHRLRQIWAQIGRRLGARYEGLPDSEQT